MKFEWVQIIGFLAKTSGAISIAFLLFMVGGHVFGPESQQLNGTKDWLALMFFPTGILFGLGLAFKWALPGGLLVLGSLVGLYLLRPDLAFAPFTMALALPGVLFTLTHFLAKLS